MTRIKSLFAATVLAATVAVVPTASAQTVHFVGAGSSAQWQAFGLSAFNDFAFGLGNAGHWTAKGKTAGGNPVAFLADPRNSQTNPIPIEPANIWIVWGGNDGGGNPTDVWTDASVDSVVGNRAFFAAAGTKTAPVHGATVNVDATLSGTAGQNAIAAQLWADNANDGALPASVFAAVNGKHVNAAVTDIRPEDAQFATKRLLTAYNALSLAGLGYNHGPNKNIGNPILSAQPSSSSKATPVNFSLHGTDPISRITVRGYTTIPVGAAPIVFFINNGGGTFTASNIIDVKKVGTKNTFPLASLFDGTECDTGSKAFGGSGGGNPITVLLREPLSGTYNTMEFTTVRLKLNAKDSQEKGVSDTTVAPFNPLNLGCTAGGGSRQRAIGTGEEVNGSSAGGGVKGIANSIGYTFFGYGNFSKLAGNSSYNYLTLDGVDPINVSYSSGLLPSCAGPCAVTPGTSFPHLRDGSYRSWSLYRVVADPNDPQLANVQALVQRTQDDVNSTIPDFVPFHTTDNSDGLDVYRSHYTQSTILGNNGTLSTSLQGNTLGGPSEAGGDMGGCIEKNPASAPGVLNCKQ